MTRRYVTWNETGREVQLAQWKEKLDEAQGNITRAGTLLGFTSRHAFRLTCEHGLNRYAAELRKKATGRVTGRPKVQKSKKL